jgi:hypothetical protein
MLGGSDDDKDSTRKSLEMVMIGSQDFEALS